MDDVAPQFPYPDVEGACHGHVIDIVYTSKYGKEAWIETASPGEISLYA